MRLKPSVPIGRSGVDAFGNRPVFVDEGDRLRAIANIGREDVLAEGLAPLHEGVRVLGASSDHLVLDVTDAAPPIAVGGRMSFRMNYGALLAAMTSEYVEKVPLHDIEAKPRSRMVQIVAEPGSSGALARHEAGARLEAVGYDVVELLQTIARKHDAVPAQVALAWLLTRPTVSSLLVGAASVKQLDENLGAADLDLDAEDLAQLDTATRPTPPYPNWFTDRVADGQAHEALGIALTTRPVR